MVADWSDAQRLAGERETLGLFLSGHPITPYEPDLKFLVSARLVDVGGPETRTAPGERGWTQASRRQWPVWCSRCAAARIASP